MKNRILFIWILFLAAVIAAIICGLGSFFLSGMWEGFFYIYFGVYVNLQYLIAADADDNTFWLLKP